MKLPQRSNWCMIVALAVAGNAAAQSDVEVLDRIVSEGTENSRVWAYLEHLSEEIGPRLTGSTAEAWAQAWARDEFTALGLQDAHLDKWGEIAVRFDRGPSVARMVEPAERDFEFTARSWSAGTDGPVRGRVLKAPKTLAVLESMRDDLAGAWILSTQPSRRRRRGGGENDEARALREELNEALRAAGIAGRIYGVRSDLVITSSARGWRELDFESLPTDVTVLVRRIDYDALNSRLADGEEVVVEIDLVHHFVEGPFPVFNTIAEIPGTEKPEEVVILSGHLDSWDGPGTKAAQDNGTGCAVTIEAARILMAAGAKPKRTIRFILWSGEEQGLLGSRAYVESLSEEERAGISAVFVEDGGTNYEGALLCIESQTSMLGEATALVNETFPDMPVELVVREKMPRGGGSDHQAFNRVGIPGYFWQERGNGGREGKNYRFIHHTQNDIMRYAVPEYLVQSATCSAITVYNLAMADTLLPRQQSEEPVLAATPEPAPSAADETPWTTAAGPLSGQWKAMLVGDEAPPDSDFSLSFEMSDDGRARGSMDSEYFTGPLATVSYDPVTKKVVFSRESEQMGTVTFRATVDGDEMKGTVLVGESFSIGFKATRVKAGEIAAQ